MARNLKTGWVVLATSGPVVHGEEDGRFIKKEWLEDMAEVYNTKVFTAKIWPEHRRYYSAGTVLAVKLEPAKEPELKGEFHLLGILSPSDWLVSANKSGDYTFPSIEVGENYRGTGKFFLKGLGVTDNPASAGVTELKFSSQSGEERAHLVAGPQFNLAESLESENDSLVKRIFSKFSESHNDHSEQEDDDMKPEQFEALQASLTEQLTTQFSALAAELKGNAEQNETEGEAPTAEQFSALQEENAGLKERLDALETKFSDMTKTPDGKETKTEETEGDGELNQVI